MEMNGLWWWIGLVWVLLHIHFNGCLGCLEQERIALLQVKASINHTHGTSLPTRWDKESNCCNWKGVRCYNGRMIQLLLDQTRDYEFGDWYLNSSLFLPFKELVYLDLSANQLAGWVEHEGFERLYELEKLEVLILGINSFNNTILPSLGMLSSLKTLSLRTNNLEGSIHTQAFHNMSNLEELDLSNNQINSFTGKEGLKSLSKLKKLDLSFNGLENVSILQTLGALSSLKELHLLNNELRGLITQEELNGLSNLEELYLDQSSIDMSFFYHVGVMTSLKVLSLTHIHTPNISLPDKGLDRVSKLEELYMDSSSIDMSFFHNIGAITSLRVLSLSSITFNGRLPNRGWCELFDLQELDLSGNDLNGTLPSCLRNLTSLRFLDLSSNHFTGNIASSPLTSLLSLEYLSLSYNDFVIPISFASFYNHSNLKVILSDKNRLSDQIVLHSSTPMFQLKVLSLSSCELNKFSGTFFHFLYHQHDLGVVDLSHNNMTGGTSFLSWLLANNTQLSHLNLRNNSFSGPFPMPNSHHPYNITKSIDISNNQIHGQLPTNIGSIFPNLKYLNMSTNELEGNIPASLGDLEFLVALDLSNNNLSGQIPDHLAIGCSSLEFFILSNNNLNGQIFPQVVNLPSLSFLYLDNNHFEGIIPDNLSAISLLSVLDISSNNMSGNLPRWFGNMYYLGIVVMSKNHFEGPIPVEFCKLDSLYILDISDNNLSGSIPSCLNTSHIEHVHLNRNKLSGQLTHAFSNTSSLVTLDLRENNLTGNIPSWIDNLSMLTILLLNSNNFEGKIPIELCQLNKLSILDLSRNNLSGPIPPCFSDISFEAYSGKSSTTRGYLIRDPRGTSLSSMVGSRLPRVELDYYSGIEDFPTSVSQAVEFTTKKISYAYKGNILDLMSGVDLSCNLLTGEIPPDIGMLSEIRALNLSHNKLIGSIPTTFSELKQVESLDLSYNHLNGTIPSQLTELNSLAVFSVSHNNLSGTTPERKAQFATFEEISYEGNPLLCGPPLLNSCTTQTGSPSTLPPNFSEEEGFMDMGVFYVTFTVSFIIAWLGVVAVLYINPYWRRAWFHVVNACGTSSYYFVLDCFLKLSNKRGV